jgi:hypothetical protein
MQGVQVVRRERHMRCRGYRWSEVRDTLDARYTDGEKLEAHEVQGIQVARSERHVRCRVYRCPEVRDTLDAGCTGGQKLETL